MIYPDFPMDKCINNEIRKTIYRIVVSSLLPNLNVLQLYKIA